MQLDKRIELKPSVLVFVALCLILLGSSPFLYPYFLSSDILNDLSNFLSGRSQAVVGRYVSTEGEPDAFKEKGGYVVLKVSGECQITSYDGMTMFCAYKLVDDTIILIGSSSKFTIQKDGSLIDGFKHVFVKH